ncbi:MAG: response regulator [Deltaproteobacteria bacterium]|nr:response regulator [Deltaproteobacteria bacterium]
MILPPRVLIVDDEERFRITLSKLLAERDLDVHHAGSGMEAVQEVQHRLYDVIILDVKMPGMDGIEALREVKRVSPGTEVILLSGHATVESAIEGMRLGAYDYVTKPCEIDVLMEKINGAVEVKSARDERLRQAEIRSLVDRRPT